MRNAKIILMLIIVIIFIIFILQLIEDIRYMNNMNSIISKSDNKTPKDQLITKEFDIKYSGVEWLDKTLLQIDELYNIECLRCISNDMYYSVTKDTNGAYLYLLFEKCNGVFKVIDYLYYDTVVYKSDFENLSINTSTIDEVRRIDKYGYEMLGPSTGRLPFSSHQTIDGFRVEITYNFDSTGKYIVFDIQYTLSDDLLVNKILPLDKLK